MLPIFNTEIIQISDPEVSKNVLVPPTLQLFRLVDHRDEKDHLHHGYQILYTGDPEMALDGNMTVTLTGDTTVEVEMPATVASFAKDYEQTKRQLKNKNKTTKAASKAHASAVGNYADDNELLKVKFLLEFRGTGETLTNAVFSGPKQFGPVRPKTCFVTRSIIFNGEEYPTTDLYAAFNIARVEPRVRQGKVKTKSGVNLMTAGLEEETASMNLNEGMDNGSTDED